MTQAERIARNDAFTDALRAIDLAIGDQEPESQTLLIVNAIKCLRDSRPVRVMSLEPVDYLSRVQTGARAAWVSQFGNIAEWNESHTSSAVVETPIGKLGAVTWKRQWIKATGQKIAWASEYYLNDEPITVSEIKNAGLARRPTTRRRKSR